MWTMLIALRQEKRGLPNVHHVSKRILEQLQATLKPDDNAELIIDLVQAPNAYAMLCTLAGIERNRLCVFADVNEGIPKVGLQLNQTVSICDSI